MPKTDILLLNKICVFMGFPGGAANAGDVRDVGSVLGLGRSPGGGNGNSLLYSHLENLMDREAWWATVHRVVKS